MEKQHDFLYNQVVNRIAFQIKNGSLLPGDKLPSVRALSEEQALSISTVFKAYSELEIKGLVEARPKSGYYVRATLKRFSSYPYRHNEEEAEVERIDTSQIVNEVYSSLTDTSLVRLSLSLPSMTIIPVTRLQKAIAEVTRNTVDKCVGYDDIQGNLALRRQISKLCFNWGGTIREDEIIATHGCMEALVFCLRTVTSPGDTVAIESPTYFGIFNTLTMLGLKVVEIHTNPETGLELSELKKAIENQPIKACLFVPTFNNPLGTCLSDETKQAMVEYLSEKQIPLIEDDTYGEMYFGKSRPKTCKSFDRDGWVMYCSSITKSLAPGFRVGWCIPGRFLKEVLQVKICSTISSTTPTHAAIAYFMETSRYDLHMRNLRKCLHLQSMQYLQAIHKYFPEGTQVLPPQGGFNLWIRLDPRINAYHLFKEALKYKISIAPGQIFSLEGRFGNYIRVSFATEFAKEIENSIEVLGMLAEKLTQKKQVLLPVF